jgi:hypothetical protein
MTLAVVMAFEILAALAPDELDRRNFKVPLVNSMPG